MSDKFTQDFIAQQRELASGSHSPAGEFAGADNSGGIVGCNGYHEESDEYEYYQIAQCGTRETAEYLAAAGRHYPAALDEIDSLRARVVELESRLDLETGNLYDVVAQDNERLRARVTELIKQCNDVYAARLDAEARLRDANEDAERLAKLVAGAVFSSRMGYVETDAGATAYRLHRARILPKQEANED